MIKKLIAKITNRHFMSLAGNGMMSVLSVVTYGILYRLLTKEEMGDWVFFQFAYILVDTFRTGFLQTALIKFYSGVESIRAKNITGSVWFLAICITAIFVLFDFLSFPLLGGLHNYSLKLFITWSGVTFLFTLPFNVATWILQAEQRFDKILYVRVINQGSFIIFIVLYAIITRGLNLNMVFYSYMSSSLLTSIVCLLAGWTSVKTLVNRSRACVSEIFHFGKYSVGTVVSSSLLKSSDTFIINFMLGPAALAVYNLPQRLMEIIEVPMRSFMATAMPEMSVQANKNNLAGVTNIMKKYAGMLTMLLIPISLVSILTSDVIVGLIGGGKYSHTEASNVFRIFMLFAVFAPIDRFMGITLDIIHKPHLNLIKVIITLIVTAVTDVIGIYLFHNIFGPAWASVFTSIVAILYGYFVLRRYLTFSIPGILQLGYSESQFMIMNIFKLNTAKS